MQGYEHTLYGFELFGISFLLGFFFAVIATNYHNRLGFKKKPLKEQRLFGSEQSSRFVILNADGGVQRLSHSSLLFPAASHHAPFWERVHNRGAYQYMCRMQWETHFVGASRICLYIIKKRNAGNLLHFIFRGKRHDKPVKVHTVS